MEQQPTPTPVAPAPPLEADEPRAPDPVALGVATEIARLRREAGLSERAAARKLGTSQTQLRRMEDPRYLPSLRSLSRVAAAYGHRVEISFKPLVEDKSERADKKKRPTTPAKRPTSEAKSRRAAPRKGRSGR